MVKTDSTQQIHKQFGSAGNLATDCLLLKAFAKFQLKFAPF